MDLNVDRVKVLYVVGVLLGVAAAFYFGFRLLEDLSPTTTSAVLVLGFLVFLFAGLYVETEILDTVFYALGAGSYVVFVFYAISKFDLGDGGVFVLLAGSSGLFIALGYASSEGVLEIERRTAAVGVVAVVVLGLALLGFDATGAQPTHTAEFEDEVEIPDLPGEAVVGEVTAENPFVLSRTADMPNYGACLYTPERRTANVRVRDGSPGDVLLGGGESRTSELTVGAVAFYDIDQETEELYEGLRGRETVPVEQANECPEGSDEVKLVVVSDGEAIPPIRGR